MAMKQVYVTVKTEKGLPEILEAAQTCLKRLGGRIDESNKGFTIKDGKNGVPLNFIYNINAEVSAKQSKKKSNEWEVCCDITYSPSGLFWGVCVLGLFALFIPCVIVAGCYFFADPSKAYQQQLDRIERELE